MNRVNVFGIRKMERDISAVQHTLNNLGVASPVNFDRARRYYDLLRKCIISEEALVKEISNELAVLARSEQFTAAQYRDLIALFQRQVKRISKASNDALERVLIKAKD
jgi:hypothetical protein